jgi:hypothetical protein
MLLQLAEFLLRCGGSLSDETVFPWLLIVLEKTSR